MTFRQPKRSRSSEKKTEKEGVDPFHTPTGDKGVGMSGVYPNTPYIRNTVATHLRADDLVRTGGRGRLRGGLHEDGDEGCDAKKTTLTFFGISVGVDSHGVFIRRLSYIVWSERCR
ncbi:hypothetical protein CEXT_78061 [Caerostris extrusa]|uniref:Uncharacterized protein n=1 Tax=Caerostris extrusa TaxID=172846 RepID=A0AAV4QDF9_CAEEX|nr:hypothetical protein CEXT_78061 [Caerostris extrusa]